MRPRPPAPPSPLERLQPEQDRRQRLPRLVVQLAREALALELLGRDDPAERIARHALRELDRDRRARGEGLREAHVVVGEAGVRRRALVVAPRSRRSRGRWTSSGTQRPARASTRRVKTRSTSGSSSTESTRSLRRRSSTRPLFDPCSGSSLADHLVAPARRRPPRSRPARRPAGSATVTSRASSRSRSRSRDQFEQAVDRSSRVASALPTSLQRLELARPARRGLVQARVLDRDRRL